jgi:hypothetical protein
MTEVFNEFSQEVSFSLFIKSVCWVYSKRMGESFANRKALSLDFILQNSFAIFKSILWVVALRTDQKGRTSFCHSFMYILNIKKLRHYVIDSFM